jgi:carbon monoxide dehydrogenase subunit G
VAELEQEITIDRDPDSVWKVLSDFGGVQAWFPGVEAVRVEGDTRYVAMLGLEVAETLRESDDAARRFSYFIPELPLPMESHLATVAVHPEGAGSRVTWSVAVVPDELLPMFADIYKGALAALKEHCES